MIINCSETSPTDIYKVLAGSIVPRPIAWVSTQSSDGIDNLAPFSFFNTFGADPPMLGFAPGFKEKVETEKGLVGIPKDTLRNVFDTKEFVVNLVSKSLVQKMNLSSAPYPAEVSEFDAVQLERAKSMMVRPSRVAKAMVAYECKLIQVVQYGFNNLVLGEVLCVHLDDRVVSDQLHIDLKVLEPIGRLAGSSYTEVTQPFDLERPTV